VKFLHPKTGGPAPVDNPAPGVNPVSPHPVENLDPGVKTSSPQDSAWGEAQRTSGVKLSSYKPSLEPSSKNQRLRQRGTSPVAIHSPAAHESSRRSDLCLNHQGLRVPPRCADCAAARAASDAAHALGPAACPHGEPGGAERCALCRRGLLPGVAPWDAVAPSPQTPRIPRSA
jgi:hypothetical protein